MIKTDKIINSLLISLAFIFNLCIFAPIEFYYLNLDNFWFPIKTVFPIIAIVSCITFLIVFILLTTLKEKKRFIIAKLFFSLLICLYLQGNYLNIGYSQLDGSIVNWNSMIFKGIINSILWIVVFVIIFKFSNETFFKKFSNVFSLLIIGIQIVTLIVILIIYVFDDVESIENNQAISTSKNYYLDTTNMFNMSKKENIVFFMVDSIDVPLLNSLLNENPDICEEFKDFTYFDNTSTSATYTLMSLPILLTGQELELGKTLQETVNSVFDKTNFYDILSENGYNSELYVNLAVVPTNESKNAISNLINKTAIIDSYSKGNLTAGLYKCVFYKYMPHFLKQPFYPDSNEFNNANSQQVNMFLEDDVKIYETLKEKNVTNNAEQKQFKVITLQAAHQPYNIKKNIKRDTSAKYLNEPLEIRQSNQVYATFEILIEYLKQLKDAGTYDNTTIIITADHGYYNRYNPVLLIKKKYEKHSTLNINHAPVSQLEDFIPTILNIASNTKDYGKDIYDYTEGESRTRRIHNYYFTRDRYGTTYLESDFQVGLQENANKLDNYYALTNTDFSVFNQLKKTYPFRKKLKFNTKSADYMATSGIAQRIGYITSKGETLGNNCEITIKPSKTNKDVVGTLNLTKIAQDIDNAKIIVKINDTILLDETIDNKPNKFNLKFEIPNDLWNKNEYLKLKFEFPNIQEKNIIENRIDVIQKFAIFNSIKFVEK